MQHVYSTHVRDLHKTIHFTCKASMVTQLLCTVVLSPLCLSIEYWGVILNLMYKTFDTVLSFSQSYSFYEHKSHALMEYNGGVEKAILRDSGSK